MMTSRTWRWVGRAWLVIVAGVWIACGVDGDRAMMGCPLGEVCDPSTPAGLNFSSRTPTDAFLASWSSVAAGGTQTIYVRALGDAPLPDTFRALSDDASVVAVEGRDETTVHIRGVSAGSTSLRIVNDRDELYDRITIFVADVDHVELRSMGNIEQVQDPPPPEWVFMRGGRAPVVAALWSAEQLRLVDTSMTFRDFPPEEVFDWDAAIMDLPSEGDSFEVAVTAGGVERVASAQLVGEVQELARLGDVGGLVRAPSVQVGDSTTICLSPTHEGRPIAGVPFELEVDGPIVAEMEYSETNLLRHGCILISGESEGTATLTVHTPGLDKVFPFRVVP